MSSSSLGERIKELRKAKKMTLEELAAATGSSKSYIWELENRDAQNPTADKLSKIARALGVTTDYLLEGNTVSQASAEDQVFFREYSNMSEDTRKTVREMARLLSKS